MNKSKAVSWNDIKKDLLANPEIKYEYEKLDPEYEIIRALIDLRVELNMSQKELADKIGTRQSNISRLESGSYNPSLKFLKKVSKALGKELKLTLV
jgi:predicted transcriptional regulator